VKDPKVVKQVKLEMGIKFNETKETNPFICGTVVNGHFKRKLKMMRADLFSLLACC